MKKLIVLLALLAAFPPLSTDMYLASIPLLVQKWHQSLATVNLTLVCFFVTYCVFLLIYGPLSDRFGRRPPLIVGISLYVVACIFCAAAGNILTMIVARAVQGAGAAAASAMAFAICKDRFDGHLRQRIFIQLGIIVAAAPMAAPVIGSWAIKLVSWRLVFIIQALLGGITLLGVLRMPESLPKASAQGFSQVAASYLRLFGNLPYILLALTFAVTGVPLFAFIAGSSDIYITRLGYNEQQFGYFFGLNAAAFLIAPIVFTRMIRRFSLIPLLTVAFTGMLGAAALMLCPWIPAPWRIFVPMWLLTFSFSFSRPPSNNLILEQVDSDVGAASSFMVFIFFITGAVAMWTISLHWEDKITVLAWLGVAASAITILSWLLINRFFVLRQPLRQGS
ncbi:MAG: MFS transporter [Desulfocapsaceae bacterium]|nr:MFS transporter [Desulfocapsaceae bacterium]